MQVLKFDSFNTGVDFVVHDIIRAINTFVPTTEKPFFVLGLPTGSTPILVYKGLVAAYQKGLVSFKNVATFNMDEYVGLSADHIQSYHYFMREHLFNHVDILKENIHILDGMADNLELECGRYEEKIASFGGIDIQLAGIGENGHLAFNEPNTSFDSITHLQNLTENTIQVNSRFFETLDEVPTQALTVGLKTIFDAKKVIVMATGEKKAAAIFNATQGEVSPYCPASILQNHAQTIFVCDKQALSMCR